METDTLTTDKQAKPGLKLSPFLQYNSAEFNKRIKAYGYVNLRVGEKHASHAAPK